MPYTINPRSRFLSCAGAFMLLASLVLTGCQVFSPAATTPQPGPTAGSTLAPAITATPTLPSIESGQASLNVWLPPDLAETALSEDGYLQKVTTQFIQETPNLAVNLMPKALQGLGGITNLLVTTKAVNPAQLPDIVVIDAADLAALTSAGISQPVDDLVAPGYWDKYYPVLVSAVTSNNEHVAIPLVTDLVFMVYDKTKVATPPTNWSVLSEVTSGYVFPTAAGDGSSADTLMLQYLSLGGKLTTADGYPTADPQIFSQILRTYKAFLELGVLPEQIRELATYEECWDMYLVNEIGMTDVRYSLYENYRVRLKRSGYAPIPLISGETGSLAHGYVWVIVTDNPAKQAVAARYIELAMQPEAVSSWAIQAKLLPATSEALVYVIQDGNFREFIQLLLYSAYPYPNTVLYARIQGLVSQAIEDVLAGVETPERAASSLSKAITSLR